MSDGEENVLTRPFLVVLALTLLGFTIEYVLRPVVPLILIDRGGSTILVGVVAAVHSFPSILFRPAIGRLIDTWNQGRLLGAGALVGAIAPLGLLAPGMAAAVRRGTRRLTTRPSHTSRSSPAPRRYSP